MLLLINQVFGLQKVKRKLKIDVAKTRRNSKFLGNQQHKLKASKEEKTTFSKTQQEIINNVEKLKKKVMLKKGIVQDDDDDTENKEPKTQSYYIIHSAQRKEKLGQEVRKLKRRQQRL